MKVSSKMLYTLYIHSQTLSIQCLWKSHHKPTVHPHAQMENLNAFKYNGAPLYSLYSHGAGKQQSYFRNEAISADPK